MADSDVSVQDVREALGEVDASEIPDSTIERAIINAEIEVEDRTGSLSGKANENAIVQAAALAAFTSLPPKVQETSMDEAVTWSVSSFTQHLKERSEQATSLAIDDVDFFEAL